MQPILIMRLASSPRLGTPAGSFIAINQILLINAIKMLPKSEGGRIAASARLSSLDTVGTLLIVVVNVSKNVTQIEVGPENVENEFCSSVRVIGVWKR